MLEGAEKVTRVRWTTTRDIVYICPQSGTEVRNSRHSVPLFDAPTDPHLPSNDPPIGGQLRFPGISHTN
jgi:hypothetical protein